MNKSTTWEKVFVALLVSTIMILCFSKREPEGFHGLPTFDVRRDEAVYDDFYVGAYDDLVHCKEKNDFEIDAFLRATRPTPKSKLLDVGSGTGHHVAALTQRGYSTMGIDRSSAMVKEARRLHPKSEFKVEDVLNPLIFPHGSFTHITCFYFTVYYMKNKRDFFKNCYDWLAPGGFLVVHLVNRAKFDQTFSSERFVENRLTKTKVSFEYRSNFDYDAKEGQALLQEEFIDTSTGAVRKNEHTLYMTKQKAILGIATSVGFQPSGRVDLSSCEYDTHYLYILRK